uniref:F-box/FBD/LRR-repeat protein At3g26920-like n=1 Tax=Cicer arietinum TaxID=3827 RepID=A0A1S3EID5_CICAR|nr:F-box/FBD/LRR-repeat protein At3g26920-like [Cicer arietinum]
MTTVTTYNHDENEEDRLSGLPEGILLHILSFLTAKKAVQTCILSKRWNNLWKHVPTLEIYYSHFTIFRSFTQFIYQILSLRDPSSALHTLNIKHINLYHLLDAKLLKTVLNYAVSYNVERLQMRFKSDIKYFPPCLFSSHTLKYLELYVSHSSHIIFPNSLNLPELTTLSLRHFYFGCDGGRVEPFSTFNKLKNLKIFLCSVVGGENLFISSATLANLIQIGYPYLGIKFELYTPSLCYFEFEGTPFQKLCGRNNNLSSVKHANINLKSRLIHENTPLALLNWMIELANIESLTVSRAALKVL